ncbi:hypothetical protein pdam_00017241 [Pocillopora damicornis]|uniref:DUF19 domain-containing protein n=1 Tax=Pocillopora damicornis TaxID=46731 RepID=A0A3M6UB29_POCDA|nr:uncharacterized protein LOC113666387 isoform X2 [Pocillopora damicornis]RMX50872.1 hypothetical protein pdam_00017241 [Pocillopora damicornis]
MAKRSEGLLLVVLITCCVLMSLSNAKRRPKSDRCLKIRHGKNCTDQDDKNITECCLKKYKLGFDVLPSSFNPSVEDPPSCALDVGLAQCLQDSKCFRKPLTRNLRLLMFNQLIFTNRTGLCTRKNFKELLEEAKTKSGAEFLQKLQAIEEMNGFDREICAKEVYGRCGSQFSKKLKTNPGYDVLKLCRVFAEEGSCTTTEAENFNCKESRLLKRFKENSREAASVVLKEICPSP